MTTTNRQFSIALEALAEPKMETTAPHSKPIPATPSLKAVLSEIGPLPREALFLGVASDGLPVLLNLHDHVPGPVLITSDAGAGKTAFLQSIVRSVIQIHQPSDVQYGVVTRHPDEWGGIGDSPHRVGIFLTCHNSAQDFILSLASWVHANKSAHQSVLLLIDDLEEVTKLDFDALQNLRWLLLRGPSRRVWPVITMNADRYGQVLKWIPNFRTRIFGQIKNERVANALGGDQTSAFNTLQARLQFSLHERENWLRFWIPSFV